MRRKKKKDMRKKERKKEYILDRTKLVTRAESHIKKNRKRLP
jgi:hypothetical protein